MINASKNLLLLVTCLISVMGQAQDRDQDEVSDFLEARWFEIEIIVFERLDVLDMHTPEQLTQTSLRQWPNNVVQMLDADALARRQTSSDKTEDLATNYEDWPAWVPEVTEQCFGVAEIDPVHPLLAPQDSFSDFDLTQSSQANTADDEQLEAIEAFELPAANEPAEEDAQETGLPFNQVPLNTPQLTLTPYLQFLADVAEFENDLRASSLNWLDELTMVGHVKAINRQRTLRPVIHRRWLQAVPERETPEPIYISTGHDEDSPLTQAGYPKIEGFIEVTVARYLHFAPTLWYHADTLGAQPISVPSQSAFNNSQDHKYMVLSESRRMRSGDLHYLDHPKFGIVVQIDPVTIPAHLESAWQSLQETEDDSN